MKTIDTKSLLLGVCITLLFLTLTSGKNAAEDNVLKVFARDKFLEIYNPSTNTLYEYGSAFVGVKTGNPINTYKIAGDGSTVE